MNCPACTSEEQRVMSTKTGPYKIMRLRECMACGHRWSTVEISSADAALMEQAIQVVRSFASLSRELDAKAAHSSTALPAPQKVTR